MVLLPVLEFNPIYGIWSLLYSSLHYLCAGCKLCLQVW